MLDQLRDGDVVTVTKYDRLARSMKDLGEYRKVWGNHAAIPVSDEDFSAGCHRSNLVRSVPSSTRVRV